MLPRRRGHRTGTVPLPVILFALALLIASGPIHPGTADPGKNAGGRSIMVGVGPPPPVPSLSSLLHSPRAPVPLALSDLALPGSRWLGPSNNTRLSIVVTLSLSNASRLDALLSALSDPASPQYHQYLNATAFAEEFSPTPGAYADALAYFGSFPIARLVAHPDRVSLSFEATSGTAAAVFHTSIGRYALDGQEYAAPSGPISLPEPIAAVVAGVEGLGTSPLTQAHPLAGYQELLPPRIGLAPVHAAVGGSPPTPVTRSGVQYVFPSDFQVAYDEQSLFALFGFPTNATTAAILWSGNYTGSGASTRCGTLTTNQDVGPYNPSDLSAFFNQTIPSGQPHAVVTPVPLGGAALPGCLSSWDSNGTVVRNTAELEATGSTAPGAKVFAVYEPRPNVTALDAALASILSPPTSLPASTRSGLLNVSVVSVGWGASDRNDPSWGASEQQAAARGITLLSAAGDSSSDPASRQWVGTKAEFPASMAFNAYGDLAVGGLTVTLNAANLLVNRQTAWNVSTTDVSQGGPAGTSGGVSSVIPEPTWQKGSSANGPIGNKGRGVPDISALANNSLTTVTINGVTYNATNVSGGGPFVAANGTAVAAGMVAGLLATIDHALVSARNPLLGYIDPTLYPLANEEYSQLLQGSVQGSIVTTLNYTYPLPTLPFFDVVAGRNFVNRTAFGYDLVTGWGSLDAYNFTMYVLKISTSGVFGDLVGVEDRLNLTGLAVTSKFSNGQTNTAYDASLQQNFFLANSLGAPVYWIQNVVYIHHTANGRWAMNFTAWIAFPFWGFPLYSNLLVFEYWFPAVGVVETLPLALTLKTVFVPGVGTTLPTVQFSFGTSGASPLTLAVPGAAFIIGRLNYTYNWQGTQYTDGPRVTTNPVGFLAPQFALVGGPSAATGYFRSPTYGNVQGFVEPSGSPVFQPASTLIVTLANTQTGESASAMIYNRSAGAFANGWTFAYDPGVLDQGILETELPQYRVQFNQTGAPSTSTWYVNLTNWPSLAAAGSNASTVTFLPNGTYNWTSAINVRNWSGTPPKGSVTVLGASRYVTLVFAPSVDSVMFRLAGPPLPFQWYVNITGGPSLQGLSSFLETNLTYGTYRYTIGSSNSSWGPSPGTGSFTISSRAAVVRVTLALVTYAIELLFQFPMGAPPRLQATIANHTRIGYLSTYTAREPNGTYLFRVDVLSPGWSASPTNGSWMVRGHGHIFTIRLTGPPPGGLFGLGVWGYVLVGGIAGGAVLAVVLLLRRRRRRAAPEEEEATPRPIRKPGRRYVDQDDI